MTGRTVGLIVGLVAAVAFAVILHTPVISTFLISVLFTFTGQIVGMMWDETHANH